MRLSQAALKLNVSTQTIVNYLSKKGIEIPNKPNMSISDNTFQLLQEEFRASIKDKDLSEEIVIDTLQADQGPTNENHKRAPFKQVTRDRTVPKLTILGTIPLSKITETLPYKSRNKLFPTKTFDKPTTKPYYKSPAKLFNKTSTKPTIKPFERSFDKPSPKPSLSRTFTESSLPKSRHMKGNPATYKGKRGASPIQKAKYRKEKKIQLAKERILQEKQAQAKILRITEFITTKELAALMDVPVNELLATCMQLGVIASINQRLDADTITIVADELGYRVEFVTTTPAAQEELFDNPDDLLPRPPIVTVMGHVDHGKTALLNHIRRETQLEVGGITQHIGAYDLPISSDKRIIFLDTPGHEAFTAMRARGAQITDIAIILIAADDGVMPQTKEAISHTQLAGVPIVIAINKIDKPGADPEKIKEELATLNILVEEWGGKYQCAHISAKTGQGIPELLDKVLLEAETLNLKANPNKEARGTIIDASLERGEGYQATLIVQQGTLYKGNVLRAGSYFGKVKTMFNAKGIPLQEASPSTPVRVIGLNGAPNAGESFQVMASERAARTTAIEHKHILRMQRLRAQNIRKLDMAIVPSEEKRKLNILLKGNLDSSIQTLADALLKLNLEQVTIKIIHQEVGQISEFDITHAITTQAMILGFQTKVSPKVSQLAQKNNVSITIHHTIYHAVEYIKEQVTKMFLPEAKEINIGQAQVKKTFQISRVGIIAGCVVSQGIIKNNSFVHFIRNGEIYHTGKIKQLKREKENIQEARAGSECGISVENFNDVLIGDVIQAFEKQKATPTN